MVNTRSQISKKLVQKLQNNVKPINLLDFNSAYYQVR